MQKIVPSLWFDDNAEEAMKFYASIFNNSKVLKTAYYGEEGPGKKGSVMTVLCQLEEQQFLAINGGPAFSFTPAISLFVNCRNEEEIDRLFNKLSEGGFVLMGLDKYPFSKKFGWVNDKYGLSWQFNLAENPDEYKQKISPCLMFVGNQHGKAEEAMKFYTSQFRNSGINRIERYEKGDNDQEGTIKHAAFTLQGHMFLAMDSGLPHAFNFTPAISFTIYCESQKEVDEYWDNLSKGGRTDQFGWLSDKYGVSWQIVPTALEKMITDPDTEKAGRVMKAMLKMNKLDIEELRNAYLNKIADHTH